MEKTAITCDVECYPNYFLVTLYRVSDGATVYIDMHNNSLKEHTLENLRAMLQRYTVVTYNGNYYDLPLIYMFLSGCNNQTLKEYSDRIIHERIKPWEIERIYKDFSIDTIDLIDLCPLQSTLKIYGGRLHTKTMQDLPLPPDAIIPQEKIGTIRKYCRNDTRITAELYNELSFNLQIREKLGAEIGVDLRSKGDAKIAETLIIKKIYSDRQTVRPLSKEEYEKHKIKQTILEMQGSVCFGDKVPEEMKVPDDFINLLKEKFKDYNNRLIGYSQECEGTFKIKDGEVTDINIRGITLIPKFKDGVKE